MSAQAKSTRLALLGVGYIGGSAAMAARRAGVATQIVGYDPDSAALAIARTTGVIDASVATPAEAVSDASVVILAAPVQSMEGLLAEIAVSVGPQATVLDVGSVKASILLAADNALPTGQFVGCHPMAGAEHVGVQAASADIFPGRVCFVCPTSQTRPAAVSAAESFWRAVGCETIRIAADVHDRLMAAQSHLPHVAAFALAAALEPSMAFLDGHRSGATPTTSLRDTTRIAASSPAVWRGILQANASHLLPLMSELEGAVRAMKEAVAAGDGTALERVLARAQSCRRRLVDR